MESAANRAAQYRKQAAELRTMAAKEIDGSTIKGQLLDMAGQYDLLAKQTEKSPYPPVSADTRQQGYAAISSRALASRLV